MSKPKLYSCKIGTVPALVILRYNYKLVPGKRIEVRYPQPNTKWQTVMIDRINPDGYFFASR